MAKQQPKVDSLPTFEDFEQDNLLELLEAEEEEDDKNDDRSEKGGDDVDDKAGDDTGAEDEDSDENDEDQDEDDDSDEGKDKGGSGSQPRGKDGKFAKKSEADEDDQDDEDLDEEPEEGSFWEDVEKITGRQVEVDYGDVDPESPEGAARREEALAQQAIVDHLDYLSKLFPKEFRALEHAANGGSIDDLYQAGEPDYSKIQIPEEDTEYQKSFMEQYYQKKGFSRQRSRRMVEADEDSDEGLFESAKSALKELTAYQEREQAQKVEEQKQEAERVRQGDMKMIKTVDTMVDGGRLNQFTIPVKEREKFYGYALNHIQRNPNGGHMITIPIEDANLEGLLQSMYFNFKGGDLSKIIQREAKTQNARKLKRRAKTVEKKRSSERDSSEGQRGGKLPTFEDFEN